MSVKINENYLLLESNYIFSEITQRVEKYQKENPDVDVISMGIGDVTRPLPQAGRKISRPFCFDQDLQIKQDPAYVLLLLYQPDHHAEECQ